jgi:hypothetical protein
MINVNNDMRTNDDNDDNEYQDRGTVEPVVNVYVHDNDIDNGSNRLSTNDIHDNIGDHVLTVHDSTYNNGNANDAHDYSSSTNVYDVLTVRDDTYSTYNNGDIISLSHLNNKDGIIEIKSDKHDNLLSQPITFTVTNDDYNSVINDCKINSDITSKHDDNTNMLPPFSTEFSDITEKTSILENPDNGTVRPNQNDETAQPFYFNAAGGFKYLSETNKKNEKIVDSKNVLPDRSSSFGDVKKKYSRNLGSSESVVERRSGRYLHIFMCLRMYVCVSLYMIMYVYTYTHTNIGNLRPEIYTFLKRRRKFLLPVIIVLWRGMISGYLERELLQSLITKKVGEYTCKCIYKYFIKDNL